MQAAGAQRHQMTTQSLPQVGAVVGRRSPATLALSGGFEAFRRLASSAAGNDSDSPYLTSSRFRVGARLGCGMGC